MAEIDPEFRRDLLSGEWVIVASDRSQRPNADVTTPHRPGECPFCEGFEAETPAEVFALRGDSLPNTRGWRVRVVPNKYPAVAPLPNVSHTPSADSPERFAGVGRHEVVIETPRHEWSISGQTDSAIGDVFLVYRDRLRAVAAEDARLAYAILFKNAGRFAGASQEHAHAQLIAMPFVPPRIANEWAVAKSHYDANGQAMLLEVIDFERSTGSRVLFETTHFFAWCPFASRFPYEVWLAPKSPAHRYEDCPDSWRDELGSAVGRILRGIEAIAKNPAYNYVLHTAALRGSIDASFVWHWEFYPRLAGIAGFELGGGMFLSTVSAEFAAEKLRTAIAGNRSS